MPSTATEWHAPADTALIVNGETADRTPVSIFTWAEGRHVTDTDIIAPREDAEDREERRASNSVMVRLERDILNMLDEMISQFQSEPLDDEPREYLDALRVLLKAQATAYMSYVRSRRDALSSTTSPMYAGAFGPDAPVPTTLRGLIEARTMATAQAARLASYVSERRTLLIFGDRATGKSTLLNALLELLPVDERFVAIEHSDPLPALKDRSFCVRLSVNDDTDIEAVFAKAMKMQPSRIVVGELHADEILYFLATLRAHSRCGGFCTVRADSVHRAVAKLLRQMEQHVSAAEARQIVGETRPVLIHMRSDERGQPRMAAIWAVEGLDAAGEILLHEEPAGQILEA
jgi:energy-coupling factor transporter ATP-binding protein EcfA2